MMRKTYLNPRGALWMAMMVEMKNRTRLVIRNKMKLEAGSRKKRNLMLSSLLSLEASSKLCGK
jgi:hypothetical protein